MIVVLVLAAGAAWESGALGLLDRRPGMVVLKRCVDVDDLLAAATSGQAEAAVLALDAPGLDAAAVEHLRRHGVRPVAVLAGEHAEAGRARADRVGITSLVLESDLVLLPDAVAAPEAPSDRPGLPVADPDGTDDPDGSTPAAAGRVITVWGPAGAPGRSTLAAALAAELARRGRRTTLVDADPCGGSLAQQLGVMDEVSGLLAAARLVQSGHLEERFDSVRRDLGGGLSLVSGLPRPDRWVEVRPGTVEQLLVAARRRGDVVVDTGFSLEDDGRELGARPARHAQTLAAIDGADEVLVVGAADPVGLSRLARGLVELQELAPGVPVRVVVNRMRPSLGWSEKDVASMITGFAPTRALHFLPEDRVAVDRALVTGRTLPEGGESSLAQAVASVADAMLGAAASTSRARSLRRRTAGRARRW